MLHCLLQLHPNKIIQFSRFFIFLFHVICLFGLVANCVCPKNGKSVNKSAKEMLANAQNCTVYTKKQIPLQKYFKSYVYCKKAWHGVPCEQLLIDLSKPFLCRCSACKMIPWMKGEAKEAKNPIFKKYLSQVKRVRGL